MKARNVFLLVLFGVALRYVDSLFEMIITVLSNYQAVHATSSQLKVNQIVGAVEGESDVEDMVIGGIVQHIYDEEEYIDEEYEDE